MTRIEDSRNHGLVRGPDASSRHSIHSPPPAMLPRWSSAQSAFSVMPGCNASRICAIACSHTAIEWRINVISSGDLMRRAFSITSNPSTIS